MNIALIGPQGSGKTTLAKYLAASKGFARHSFADALREEIAAAMATPEFPAGRIRAQMDDPVLKASWRPLMQLWGSEIRRDLFDRDYWVRKLEDVIQSADHRRPIVVDDCRYPNEHEMLLRHGFKFIKLAPHPEGRHVEDNHSSELHWPFWPVAGEVEWVDGPARRADLMWVVLHG